jgi:23S rRNA (guanosine2251-2'-O)-methyltransferase
VTGIHAVAAALRENTERVKRILVQADVKPHPARDAMLAEARQKGIPVEEEQSEYFKRLAAGRNTQGIAAELRPFDYADLDDLLKLRETTPLLVVLDGVTDPQNLGAIMRSAAFFGATGIVIPKDRSVHVNPTVERAAAGAAAFLPVAMVTNLARALDDMKEAGLWVIGSVPEGGEQLSAVDLVAPSALVLGAEGGGMRRLTTDKCDRLVTLSPGGRMESLNVSVFTGIFLYEAVRQRGPARPGQPGR